MPLLIACASAQKAVPPETSAQKTVPPEVPQQTAAVNPFFAESPLPLHYPPFERIHESDYVPAFEAGMAEQLKEVKAIAHHPAPATFENTFVALEKSGSLLRSVQTVFSHLNAAKGDPAMERIVLRITRRLSA